MEVYCDQCRKTIGDEKLAYFSNREENLDFCSKNCHLLWKSKKIGIDIDDTFRSKIESSELAVSSKDMDAIGVQIVKSQESLVKENKIKVEGDRSCTGIKISGSSNVEVVRSIINVRSTGSATGFYVGTIRKSVENIQEEQPQKKIKLSQEETKRVSENLQNSQLQLQEQKKIVKEAKEANQQLQIESQQLNNSLFCQK